MFKWGQMWGFKNLPPAGNLTKILWTVYTVPQVGLVVNVCHANTKAAAAATAAQARKSAGQCRRIVTHRFNCGRILRAEGENVFPLKCK